RIPCIYIYPENLGIIEFSFSVRLTNVLKYHNLKKQLLRYRAIRIFKKCNQNFLFLFLSLLGLLVLDISWADDKGTIIFFILIILFQTYLIIREFMDTFK
ncbi:unnamed protein product, partial [Ectocarpus sp. 4 AP-2014]